MSTHPLDTPTIVNNLFFPRRTVMPTTRSNIIKYGTIPVADNIAIGYSLFIHTESAPVLLYFHGNGEIASDYEGLAPLYHTVGLTLLVVDYRGYGWSSGTPLTSQMLPDAAKALAAVPAILEQAGIEAHRPLFVKGRSLGSAPAVYLAHQHPDKIKGLIIESGYADAPSLFRRLGIPIPDDIQDDIHLPINNANKMQNTQTPLLVIHGANDVLIPVEQGKALFAASPVTEKELVIIDGAGHNDLLFAGTAKYFDAIRRFVEKHS